MKYLSFIIFIVSNLNCRYFPVLFTVVYRFLPGWTEITVLVSTVKKCAIKRKHQQPDEKHLGGSDEVAQQFLDTKEWQTVSDYFIFTKQKTASCIQGYQYENDRRPQEDKTGIS
jgi:hypothetical protein